MKQNYSYLIHPLVLCDSKGNALKMADRKIRQMSKRYIQWHTENKYGTEIEQIFLHVTIVYWNTQTLEVRYLVWTLLVYFQ